MTVKIANALSGYIETLYVLNQNLITLCGLDVIDNYGQYEKLIQDVIQAIPRLIPYRKEKGELKLDKKDGLLEYSEQIDGLMDGYMNILLQNYDILDKLKEVRNKFEHRMHGVRLIGGSNTGRKVSFQMTYAVEDQEITIVSSKLIILVKELNVLFANIQEKIEKFAYDEEKSDHPYYRRLLRYSFTDFNLIYESDLLGIVGKALYPF